MQRLPRATAQRVIARGRGNGHVLPSSLAPSVALGCAGQIHWPSAGQIGRRKLTVIRRNVCGVDGLSRWGSMAGGRQTDQGATSDQQNFRQASMKFPCRQRDSLLHPRSRACLSRQLRRSWPTHGIGSAPVGASRTRPGHTSLHHSDPPRRPPSWTAAVSLSLFRSRMDADKIEGTNIWPKQTRCPVGTQCPHRTTSRSSTPADFSFRSRDSILSCGPSSRMTSSDGQKDTPFSARS
ncbi:hypothetical protein B0I37DRAFT_38836 [Chaetomium sp. MPI-CAGE-AT-0009]|nr:hypothetical protein B0I37DRAFT_38836 [Chaetomium sp. MPI-CAGE-AT-0009]